MQNWGRLITAMVTPFNHDGSVDYEKAGILARQIIANGSDAVVVCGTTGESPTLSVDEKTTLFKTVKNYLGDKGAVIAGSGSNCTADSVKLSKAAEMAGADGLLLIVPYYNKPPQDGLYEHFKTIAFNTSLPVMLYNVPGRTSCNLLPETVARLAEIPNILAIKDAAGSLSQTQKLLSLLPKDFRIYSGDDGLALAMLAVGAAGVVSVAGQVAGGAIKKMINYYTEAENQKAQAINLKLLPLFEHLFITTNPIPVKEMLNQMGAAVGGYRLPLSNPSADIRAKLKDCLAQYDGTGLLDSYMLSEY